MGAGNLLAVLFGICSIFVLFDPVADIPYRLSLPVCCYLHFVADFFWSVSSSVNNYFTFLVERVPVFEAYNFKLYHNAHVDRK